MLVPRQHLELILLLAPLSSLAAQTPPELKQILERLDRLERENRELREEVRSLREQIRPAAPPGVEERLDIAERRIEEQAQTKVEASQRFPVRLTGMALVNTFLNSRQNGGVDNPTIASLGRGDAVGGATWRQSVIGLEYRGPQTLWGGRVRGALFMDFFGGTYLPLGSAVRLRTALFGLDWASSSFTIGQDKPILSPREPDSLAQVGVSPLTAAGNLWLWQRQARFEQRFRFTDQAGLRAQIGVVQTSETAANVPAGFAASLERYRPGLEGHFELFRNWSEDRRVEVAGGFHVSTTHVAGGSVPSNAGSIDWLIAPSRVVQFTGFAFAGENVAHFGTGGIRQGFTILGPRNILPVRARGGWSQFTLRATDRLSFHVLGGIHDNRNADLPFGGVARNMAYGANFYYRLAPNVITSFETLQTRTTYLGNGNRLNNHYDLSFAYLF